MLMLTCTVFVRHSVIARVLTFYMDIYVNHLNFRLLFLPKLCGCPPIVKFLQKSLWVPGPPGPDLPHPMTISTIELVLYIILVRLCEYFQKCSDPAHGRPVCRARGGGARAPPDFVRLM